MIRLNFLNNLLGAKFYLAGFVLLFAIGYAWHSGQVSKLEQEVTQRVSNEINLEYSKRLIEVQEQSMQAQTTLITKHEEVENDLTKRLSVVSAKYNAAIARLPNSTSNTSTVTDANIASTPATSDSEGRPEVTEAGLPRTNAEFLIGFATEAETIKQHLLYCYSEYDNARQVLLDYKQGRLKNLQEP